MWRARPGVDDDRAWTWLPIFHSSNLVDWTQIGNVLDRLSQLDLRDSARWASLGIFAPTIRHHEEKLWMITTIATTKGIRNFFVTATRAPGPTRS